MRFEIWSLEKAVRRAKREVRKNENLGKTIETRVMNLINSTQEKSRAKLLNFGLWTLDFGFIELALLG